MSKDWKTPLNFEYKPYTEDNDLKEFLSRGTSRFDLHVQEMASGYRDHLSDVLEHSLKNMGHFFSSNDQFEEFLKKRVTRISTNNLLFNWEFYLDYSNDDDKGFLLLSTGPKLKIETIEEKGKVTIMGTIG